VRAQRVRLHPADLEEAEAAMDWYGKRSGRAARSLLNELDRTIEQISLHPKRYWLREFKTPRAVLRRFSYLIVFREGMDGIEVIALMHGRRRPGYWRDRP
jgi:toxin ParE1/3/4